MAGADDAKPSATRIQSLPPEAAPGCDDFFIHHIILLVDCSDARHKTDRGANGVMCEPCGRQGRYSVARLMEKYGDMKLPELRHVLANCPKAKTGSFRDRCRVVYGKDSRF